MCGGGVGLGASDGPDRGVGRGRSDEGVGLEVGRGSRTRDRTKGVRREVGLGVGLGVRLGGQTGGLGQKVEQGGSQLEVGRGV